MNDFFDVILSFPTVLFTFLLGVVAVYWAAVVVGGVDLDLFDTDVDVDPDVDGDAGGLGGLLATLGLHGVPITVTLSILIVVAWFVSLVGTALVGSDRTGVLAVGVLVAVLVVAVICAWTVARILAGPLRRVLGPQRSAHRTDFVGRVCVIRTARVTAVYGQAEVTADDGGTATVQVRTERADIDLTNGMRALIHGYDAEHEHFWVSPADAELDPLV